MIKKAVLFLLTLILVGVSDWVTTLMGVSFFGANETNPLLAGLVGSNMFVFSLVKLSAVVATGWAFYKAVGISTNLNLAAAKRSLDISYLATFMFLSCVVINNVNVML